MKKKWHRITRDEPAPSLAGLALTAGTAAALVAGVFVLTGRWATNERARSEERYRSYVGQTSEGIWRFELDPPIPIGLGAEEAREAVVQSQSYLAECNDAMARLYGYSRAADLVGAGIETLLVPSDPFNLEAMRTFIAGGYHSAEAELRVLDRHGRSKIFNCNLTGIVRGGKVLRVWGSSRDVTDRKRMESEREELLERERVARSDAERANRSKDEFLATLSHELRTPLIAILGWVNLLLSGHLGESETSKALTTIERNARRQSQLIDDLLDVSKIAEGALRMDRAPVDVAGVLEAVIESLRPVADEKGIEVRRALDCSCGLVIGDAARIEQVVWNLLQNAIRFTPARGVVEVRLERADPDLHIVVTDTGRGIKPEFLPHVFDRFRQAEPSTKRHHGGMGLGLSIVRGLVTLHGGTVEASSPGDGKGATFTVSLPVDRFADRGRDRTETPTNGHPSLKGLRVLVVDDDPDACDLVARILRGSEAEVAAAGSVVEAMRAFAERAPDVVVSDIAMPDEDGYDLIRKIRAKSKGEGGQIPAVALTAFARPDDRLFALRAGFQRHVAKPVNPSELVGAVANVVGRSQRGHG